ncbi:MAG: chemotaxis response regulator protein-glutamate methylesterase [Opitutaceae bacterium]|nr:chemotaxis response regulator protein-glutamate methylesterase [Opitutaceae bacterium]
MSNPIKVLVVDDSPVVRQAMTAVLGADPDIEVIGAAADPYEAVALMRTTTPDVITLDIEMPRMDGLTFLKKIMAQHPIPVVVCSSHTTEGSDVTARVFEYGAVDIITKPRLGTETFLAESQIMICDAVKAAAGVRADRLAPRPPAQRKLTADAMLAKAGPSAAARVGTDRLIVIGASTGGTEAVGLVLEALPAECPGIVVVQHMPEGFTRSFASSLDAFCRLKVKEAADGDLVIPGQVLIAPGGRHTLIKRQGTGYAVEVRDGPLVSRHRPSVDVLFRSAARYAGPNASAAILTGMGDDGALGLKELRDAGAFTVAQDEDSSVVFGMPKEAIKRGGAVRVCSLELISTALLRGR